MKNKGFYLLGIILVLIIIFGGFIWYYIANIQAGIDVKFDGARALIDIKNQVDFGPRIPASTAHNNEINYILQELTKAGWHAKVLEDEIDGHKAQNILATRGSEEPVILIGAHYDSRIVADNDSSPANRLLPVPAADDGASGVAVLLELARVFPKNNISTALLFIDIEDNGNIPGWDWLLGSRAFANRMTFYPKAVVILDMIGDKDLNIYMEQNSDPELTSQIWDTAKALGYSNFFIPEYKYRVLDDHIPFIEKGIKAVDIIDLDYPYWHTLADTSDKVSAKSLQIVGDTLLAWLINYGPCLSKVKCN